MCDLAWVVLSDRVRTLTLADRQSLLTAAFLAGAAGKVDLPDPERAVDDFAALLAAPPAPRAADHDLRVLLGVA